MFAHQAIEDLGRKIMDEDTLKFEIADRLVPVHEEYYEIQSRLIKLITDSQKFHLGEATDILKTFTRPGLNRDSDEGLVPFFKVSDVRFPFPITWWDYLMDGKQNKKKVHSGILAQAINQNPEMVKLYFFDKGKEWTLVPVENISYMDGSDGTSRFLVDTKGFSREETLKESGFEDSVMLPGFIVEQALRILSCKNVVTAREAAPEKLNKKRIRRGNLPLFSYYTLRIKKTFKKNINRSQSGNHNRVHLCRGHFKHFTEKNPLFGKFTGRYWWQPQARGQNRNGVVMKDYEVDL